MKKTLIILLAILMVISVTACGSSDKTAKETTAPVISDVTEAATEAARTDDTMVSLDSFVTPGNIYFDLHITDESIKGFSLSVGGQTLTGSGQVAFNKDDTLTQSGEPVEGKKFYVYTVRNYKDNDKTSLENFVNIGIRADKLGEMLTKLYSRLENSTMAYVAVLETPDGWDHNLSEGLNRYLTSIVPKE